MSRSLLRCGVFGAIVSCMIVSVQAAKKPKTTGAPVDAVQEILQSEADAANTSVDRREGLKPASRPQEDPDSIWWQAGYIQSGKQWRPLEETVATDSDAKLLDEYQAQRSHLAKLPHSQWKLANWCRKSGLYDQERVHLLRVLAERDATVNTESVYERLGCESIGGSWVSLKERRDAATMNAEAEQSQKRWSSKLAGIVALLKGPAKQRALGEKQLAEITHPSAVSVIVETLCLSNESLAELGVKTLSQIPEFQASRALAGQAAFSPWKQVRKKAIESIRQRKLEEFAPDLLLLLSNPIRTKIDVATNSKPAQTQSIAVAPDIMLNMDYVWIEETPDTVRVGIRRLFPISTPGNLHEVVSLYHPQITGTFDKNGQRTAGTPELALIDLAAQKDRLDYQAESLNDSRQDLNERVGSVLSQCTDAPMSSEPKVWWDWWTTHSSVAPTEDKQVVIVDERQFQPNLPSISRTTTQISCLVAGTPIWTERGFVAIEQILPGDRVLSKEIESGQLRYKPVLKTTVREPTAVHRFRVGDDSVVASPGHHFWASGDGWTKMRELVPQLPLHTATGMLRVTSIEDEGRSEKVYNLVVADFHTYFVGRLMVLCHDVTTPALTNFKVPGLIPQ